MDGSRRCPPAFRCGQSFASPVLGVGDAVSLRPSLSGRARVARWPSHWSGCAGRRCAGQGADQGLPLVRRGGLGASLRSAATTQEEAMTSTNEVRRDDATAAGSAGTLDMKLEVVTVPVSDVERATAFYARLGWRQDATPPNSGVVQFTPPGS